MALKTYLIVLSKDHDRTKVKDFFNAHKDVSYWFFNLPNTLFINTTLTPKQIWEALEREFGEKRAFICEATNHYGRLPKEHWELFKK